MKRLLLLTAIFLTACGPSIKEKEGIDGFWLHRATNDNNSFGSAVITAEFINQRLILNKYETDSFGLETSPTFQQIFDYLAIDDTRIEVFGRGILESDFMVNLDTESNSLSISSPTLSNLLSFLSIKLPETFTGLKFTRPANLSRKEISGNWLDQMDIDDDRGRQTFYVLTTRNDSSSSLTKSLELHHGKKTYTYDESYICEDTLTHGFILREKCGDAEGYNLWFIVSADRNSINYFSPSMDIDFEAKRVSSDKLPSPPKGYKEK
jgi:hypothetical protein